MRPLEILGILALVTAAQGVVAAPEDDAAGPKSAVVDSEKKESVHEALEGARALYVSGDQAAAAKKVNRAVVLLRGEAGRATGQTADDLRDAIAGLEKLAGKLERGAVKSEDEFKKTYATVYQELSLYHYAEAEKAYAGHEHDADDESGKNATWRAKVRHNLNESMADLKAWSKETGHKLKEGSQAAAPKIKKWTGEAMAGTGHATEKIGETLHRWGEELHGYGRGVAQRGAAEDAATTHSQNP